MSHSLSRSRAAATRSSPAWAEPVAERGPGPECQEVLLLGRDHVRAVDAEQRLAGADLLADVVDVDLLDEARELEAHVVHPRLVHRDPAHRSPAPADRALRHRRGAEPDELLALGIDPHRGEAGGEAEPRPARPSRPRRSPCPSRPCAASARSPWDPSASGRRGACARCGRGARRDQLHAADGALPRLVRGDARVHRADIGGVGVGAPRRPCRGRPPAGGGRARWRPPRRRGRARAR